MQKLRTFFNTLVKSVSSPAYYADVITAKIGFSLKYFLMLTFVLSIVTAFKIMIPLAIFNLAAATDQVVTQYPADLDVKITNGRLSINQPVPYLVPIRKDWQDNGPKNFVVFESDNNISSPQDFYKYDTFALVTETSVYTNQENSSANSIKVYEIPQDTKDFEVNEGMVKNWESQFLNMPAVKNKLYVPAVGVLLLVLLVPLMYLFRLSTAYIYAVILFLLIKLFKKSLTNGTEFSVSKLFQISLHTTTLPILLAYVLSFTAYNPVQGLLYFLIYFIFTVMVLKKSTSGNVPTIRTTLVKPAPAKIAAKSVPSKKKK